MNGERAYERITEALRAAGKLVKPRGSNRAEAQCPAHDDGNPSLAITGIEGQVLIYCHAGCRTEDVLAALGLGLGDLFDDPRGPTYAYDDGRKVHRTPDKQFPQWGNTNGQRTTLYHLSRIKEARAKGEPVLLVEGEKDVHAIESLGAYATCAPMGAANFGKIDPSPLYGLEVVAIVDNDEAGEKQWAPRVLAALDGKAAALNFAKGKVDTEHADIADHIAAGYSLAEIVPWVPPEPEPGEQDDMPPEPEPGEQDDDAWRTEQEAAFQLTRDVEREARRLRVRDLARQKIIQESAVGLTLPEFIRLDDFLAQPDSTTPYLVDETWPKGGHILFAAQQKAGKTTARNNLVKALADGYDFLGKFQITRPEGAVVILDLELPEDMLRRWMRDIGISNQQQLVLVPMRGKGATLNLGLPEVRARWVARLREWGASVVILDCLRPVLDALRLSEDKDASKFLGDFDAMLVEAGVPDAMVIHHMGHGQERARGDSGILGWADAIWTLVLKDPQNPASPRYFRAYGRIERDIPESMLDYDDLTRRLTLVGGTRADSDADAAKPHVVTYLRAHPLTKETPAPSQTAIQKALKDDLSIPVKVTKRAIEGLVRKRVVDVRPGRTGTATAHHLTDLADEEYPPPTEETS
jgi:5S rRNA maturation endonuclease (ribonuclease M5)